MPQEAESIEARLAAFTGLCRRAGLRATPQRLEIFRQVVQAAAHPDVDTVWSRVRQRLPTVSLDTVYRTLKFLDEAGLIQRLSRLDGSVRYDANLRQHHHFVCTRCGGVWDFCSEALDRLGSPPEVAALGSVESIHAELHGICAACRQGVLGQRRPRGVGRKGLR